MKKEKKKVIIFGYTLEMGGAERALINVIDFIKESCDIDLVLLENKGSLTKDLDKRVNVIEMKKNFFQYVLFRFVPFYRKHTINKLQNNKYDIAIAFMEGRCATWVADLKGDMKKIAWIHNDVNKFNIGISDKEIVSSYSKMDKIVAVSIQSQENFCSKYGFTEDKVEVIYNLINEESILKKASEFTPKKEAFTFVNVAKMRTQKRHDRLLEIASRLKAENLDFKLWLIGDGPLEKEVRNSVHNQSLDDVVEVMGLQENPFPYIKAADFFVMSSDHEGYPLSLLEALLLKTPIVTTDVSGAREMLKDSKYGYIVDIDTDKLFTKMQDILVNRQYSEIVKNLETYQGTNKKIMKQLKNLFCLD